MEIVSNLSGDTLDGGVTTLNLQQFAKLSSEKVLMFGFNSTHDPFLHSLYKNHKNRYLYDMFSPCALYSHNNGKTYIDLVEYFTRIYCTCPYTTSWYNKFYKNKIQYIAMCMNETLIPKSFEKHYDICYIGCIADHIIQECIDIISKFKYKFVTRREIAEDIQSNLITDFRVSMQTKLNIISQCKISVCYNMLFLEPRHFNVFLKQPNIQHHGAFPDFEKSLNKIHYKANLPQFKMRCHEAAAGKSLILCQKDPWNLIENYYEPNKEFIYFENNEELYIKILDILDNWDYYQTIAETAHQKLLKYYLRPRFCSAIDRDTLNWSNYE